MNESIPYFLLISGKPFQFDDYHFKPPTLNFLRDNNGENYHIYLYYLYLLLCSKLDIIKMLRLQEQYNQLSFETRTYFTKFRLLLSSGGAEILQQAIQFFVEDTVVFNQDESCFLLYHNKKNIKKLDNSNFLTFCDYISQIAYRNKHNDEGSIEDKEFASEKAKQRYIEIQKRKTDFNKTKTENNTENSNFELGNVIAKLSAKSDSGYNLINIFDLTVFQLYDQFYQIVYNNQIEGYVHKWAAWGTEDFDFSLWYQNNKQ